MGNGNLFLATKGYFLVFFTSKAAFVEASKYLEERGKEELAKINEYRRKLRLDIFPIPFCYSSSKRRYGELFSVRTASL